MRRALALALAVSLCSSGAWAQDRAATLSGSGLAFFAEQRLRYAGRLLDQSGRWFGGEAVAHAGRWTVRVSGLSGTLGGDSAVLDPDRKVRVTEVAAGVAVAGGLQVGAEAAARRDWTDATLVGRRLVGGYAQLALPLGVDGLSGSVRAAWHPATSTTGDERLDRSLRGELGVTYAPRWTALVARLAYAFERYDYASSGSRPGRIEKVRGVLIGLGVRVRR